MAIHIDYDREENKIELILDSQGNVISTLVMISIIHYILKFNCKIDTWNSNSLEKRLDYKLEINLDFYVKWHPLPFFKVHTIKDVTKYFFASRHF